MVADQWCWWDLIENKQWKGVSVYENIAKTTPFHANSGGGAGGAMKSW
jgi:hypothetical protein